MFAIENTRTGHYFVFAGLFLCCTNTKKSGMFQQLIKSFQSGGGKQTEPERHALERVAAVLLIEIARADTEVDDAELAAISRAIENSCHSISPDELVEIVTTARQDAESSISFHDHVRQVNSGFSRQQKLELIEQMWRVAYADGDLDKYEEYTIRKLSDLLFVEHQEFIRAKLRVLDGLNNSV